MLPVWSLIDVPGLYQSDSAISFSLPSRPKPRVRGDTQQPTYRGITSDQHKQHHGSERLARVSRSGFRLDFGSAGGLAFFGWFRCRHSHRAKLMAASPTAPRFRRRTALGRTASATSSCRYTAAASGGAADRDPVRRSGTGTQREMYANDSDAHTGHCWAS